MKDKIIALIWAWTSSYEPNGKYIIESLQKENLYGNPHSPISENEIETNEAEPHILGFWYCNLLPTLTDWFDLTDLVCEGSEIGPQVFWIYTDSTKGVVQVYFDKTKDEQPTSISGVAQANPAHVL